MGNFYVSFTVPFTNSATVLESLAQFRRDAIVAEQAGVVVFYDEEADQQDPLIIEALANDISADVKRPVLAVLNHDGILMYWLSEGGRCIDRYNSCPGGFVGRQRRPEGGDSKLLCAAFKRPDALIDKVEWVLRKQYSSNTYVLAVERHRDVLADLGLPPELGCCGYETVANLPKGTKVTRVGDEV